MTWIKTIRMEEADERLKKAMGGQAKLYPIEYATPVTAVPGAGGSAGKSSTGTPS